MLVCLNIIELAEGLRDTSSGCPPISILFLLNRSCSLLLSITDKITNIDKNCYLVLIV